MKVKLDENLGIELKSALSWAGHDVETVFDEGLQGTRDADRPVRSVPKVKVDCSSPLVALLVTHLLEDLAQQWFPLSA